MGLGLLEFEVLRALRRHPNSHGNQITKALERTHCGGVYTTLMRLEEKAFVISQWSAPTDKRGGRRARLYSLTWDGVEALLAFERRYAREPAL